MKFLGRLGTCLVLALAGCSESYKLVPAEGVVNIGNKPAANFSVQFLPDATKNTKGPTSFGTTDAQGKFTLVTKGGKPGAVAGSHQVILADMEEERTPQGETPKRPRLDPKYNSALTGLKAEVKGDGAPIVLNVP